jgi:hypothetical protein
MKGGSPPTLKGDQIEVDILRGQRVHTKRDGKEERETKIVVLVVQK